MAYLKIISRLSFSILIVFSFAFAQTEISGLINSNTTWDSAGSPYIVTDDILVWSGVTLTIGPGVVIKFSEDKYLQIDGELIAVGTESDSILFTANSDMPDSHPWRNIKFSNTASGSIIINDSTYISGSIFKYCVIEFGGSNVGNGGAIFSEVNLYIENSRFSNNTSGKLGLYDQYGGAIYSLNNLVVKDVIFYSNNVSNSRNSLGGAIACEGTIIVNNCIFKNNYCSGYGKGGAIYFTGLSGKIINCVFSNNQANYSNNRGGAIYGGSLEIEDCDFIKNRSGSGGALYGNNNIINNCNFIDNEAGLNGQGGGISGSNIIQNSTFLGNKVPGGDSSRGGAISDGGTIVNCTFIENYVRASRWAMGGAISGSGYFKNNFFKNNYAELYGTPGSIPSHGGGAIYINGNTTIINNTFVGNYSYDMGQAVSFPLGDFTVNIYSNYFYGNGSGPVLEGKIHGNNNTFFNNNGYGIKLTQDSGHWDFTKNFFFSKDSTYIANNMIYDFYDDFGLGFVDFVPFLNSPSDTLPGLPNNINLISLKEDFNYDQGLTDSVYIGSDLFIQLEAIDINSYCPDLTPVYITNLSLQDTVIATLVESGDSTGIFRVTASVQGSTDNINDIIGANVGDEIKIVSKTDPAKHYSFIVAQTPPPDITNIDVGGTNDIFHILDSTPLVSWTYSDPLSSPQSGYQVQVGLDTNWTITEIWDTGEISSSDAFVVYAGDALNKDLTYYVRARVKNGTFWSNWADTSFALNSHPQMELIDTSVSEDDTLFLNVNDFISDSDDHDSLLNVSSNSSDNIVVNINMNSHEARFIPVENWNGSEKIGFICTDPWGFQTIDSLTITVLPVNDAPEITTNELPNATEDQEYSFTIEATDVDMVYGDHLNYSLTVYPDGMSINSYSGEINWLPDNNDVGDTTVTVVVTDDSSATDTQSFTLTISNVNDPPVFTEIPDKSINEDGPLSIAISYFYDYVNDPDNSDNALAFTFIGQDNVIVSTSADSVHLSSPLDWNGSDTLEVIVSDGSLSNTTSWKITVKPVNDAPVITTTELPSATEDQAYSFTVEATDADLVYGDHLIYSLSVYPEGMTINSTTGIISWLPDNEDVGDTTITVLISDDSSATDTQSYTLTIGNVNDPPVFSTIPDKSINEDEPLSIAISYFYDFVDDPDNADNTLSFIFIDEDNINVNVTADSVQLSAQVNWSGIDTLDVVVSDGSLSDTTSWKIIVKPINDAPEITTTELSNPIEDQAYNITIEATDADWVYGDHLSYSLSVKPAGMTINSTTGIISWLPDNSDVGDTTVTVVVTDDSSATDTKIYSLHINNTNDAPVIVTALIDDAVEDQGYIFIIGATDIDLPYGDHMIYRLSVYPQGMTINRKTGEINWLPDNDNVGDTTITVLVTDDSSATDEKNFTMIVHNTNDTPAVAFLIPDQSTYEDALFTFTFGDSVFNDVDFGDSLRYSATLSDDSDLPGWLRFEASLPRTFSGIPSNDDVGKIIIKVKATDDSSAMVNTKFNLEVVNSNDTPVFSEIPDTSFNEDNRLTVALSYFCTYVDDPDNADSTLSFVFNGTDYINASASGDSLLLYSQTNWNGIDTIGVIVSDGSLSDTTSWRIIVNPVNDAPEITTTELPNATEDQEYSFTVEATDVDMVYGDHLTYNLTVYPDGMSINSSTGEISWLPDNDDVGAIVTVVVTDDSNAIDVKTYTLTVENVNDPPMFTSPLPDTSFDEDTTFEHPLSDWFDYVEDIDDADSALVWNIEGNDSVFTLISVNKVVFSSPLNWYGKDILKVIVTDGELSDTTNLIVTVNPVNDVPVISDIPDTSFVEDDSLSLDLDNYVVDVDDPSSSLIWDVSLIDGDGLLLSAGQNSDVLTKFYQVANRYVSKKSANIKSKGIPLTNKFRGSSITSKADSQTSGIASEEGSIKVVIDPMTHILTFSATDDYFVENVPFLFTVNDTCGAADTDTMRITINPVNDPPVLSPIPDTSFDEDDRLTVALSYFYTYVDDPDNADSALTIAFSNTEYINITTTEDSILLTAQADWNGTDTIQVIVSDESLSDTTSWRIIVNPVNDAPVITSADSVFATEDIHFKYLATASDIEDSSITFSFDDLPCWLSSDVDSVYGIPSEGMQDTSFIVIASDGELNDTLTVILTVIFVNDPPIISTIPDTSFDEDEQLKFAISYFYDFVYDPDNADSSLTWSFSDTDYVYVTMNEDSITLSSQIDWFGKDTLFAKVSDGEFSDEASFVITVRPVNDPPYFTELMPDSILFYSNVRDTLLLAELAFDIDNPDSTLNWSYIRSNFILCHINDTMKTAIFWVEENLSGQDTVVLSVSDGEFTVYDSLIVIVSPVTGIEYLMSQLPKEYSLKQNYPNPFNPVTNILYGIPKQSHVNIKIYDLIGREVVTLVNQDQQAKHYNILWDAKDNYGNNVSSGMYLYRIVASSDDKVFTKTRKLLLLR